MAAEGAWPTVNENVPLLLEAFKVIDKDPFSPFSYLEEFFLSSFAQSQRNFGGGEGKIQAELENTKLKTNTVKALKG